MMPAFLATAAAVLASAFALEALRVPSGALVGGVLGGVLARAAGVTPPGVPSVVRVLLFAGLGLLIAQSLTAETMGAIRAQAPLVVAIVATLVVVGGLVALVAVAVGGVDPLTAFLAASPGALSQMTALSIDLRANVGVVVAVHVARVLTVLAVAPFISRFLSTP